MRLDKFIVEAGLATRTEVARLCKAGAVCVNGVVVRRASGHIEPVTDKVTLHGKEVVWREFTYVMLNKPDGYVSATDDGKFPTVIELLPEELQRIGLFPCGRLDKNTLGLMLLTNNGPLAHKLLAPKNHVDKKYRFTVKFPISESDVAELQSGVDIGGYITAPCIVEMIDEKNGFITLTEGKYHQIKLMFAARCNKILTLHRQSFGGISLDPALKEGNWRYLSEEELSILKNQTT